MFQRRTKNFVDLSWSNLILLNPIWFNYGCHHKLCFIFFMIESSCDYSFLRNLSSTNMSLVLFSKDAVFSVWIKNIIFYKLVNNSTTFFTFHFMWKKNSSTFVFFCRNHKNLLQLPIRLNISRDLFLVSLSLINISISCE